MKYCVDVNLLLYAHHAIYPLHSQARDWLQAALTDGEGLAMPWESLLGFVRLSVKRGVLPEPIPLEAAWQRVQTMLDSRRVWIAEPTARHREVLSRLLPLVKGQGNEISDTHIAAIAIQHRLTLCTLDSGFARLEPAGLSWHNPLN